MIAAILNGFVITTVSSIGTLYVLLAHFWFRRAQRLPVMLSVPNYLFGLAYLGTGLLWLFVSCLVIKESEFFFGVSLILVATFMSASLFSKAISFAENMWVRN